MHSTGVAIACMLVTAVSVFGIGFPPSVTLALLGVSIALIGVPHGGLDHWSGRRLLGTRFPRSWALIFFPAYVSVSLLVGLGWSVVPLFTAVLFFVVSAWHFGLEDELPKVRSRLIHSMVAVAVGGLVIWVPVLTQPARLESILESIVPHELSVSATLIVSTTWWIAVAMTPIAALLTLEDLLRARTRPRAARNVSFAAMFAVADILVSFGIYFCAWHSVRGLRRLARENATSLAAVFAAAMPLSVGAILLAILGIGLTFSNQTTTEAVSRTLFIGLSAIAVPHLLLHGPITQLMPSAVASDSTVRHSMGVAQ